MPAGVTVTQRNDIESSVKGVLFQPVSQVFCTMLPRAKPLKETILESNVNTT